MNRYTIKGWLWLVMAFAFLFSSCNEEVTEVVTEYQRKNDAFVEVVSNDNRYTKLEFLHEGPIYYRVLTAAPDANKDNKPLQNSKVSVYLKGIFPKLQLLSLEEVKALKDVMPLIASGEEFQHKSDKPTPLWVQEKNINSSGSVSTIKGVQVALQNMAVGEKWEVVIPWQMGYRGYSFSGVIPAYSTLVFEIELVDILEK